MKPYRKLRRTRLFFLDQKLSNIKYFRHREWSIRNLRKHLLPEVKGGDLWEQAKKQQALNSRSQQSRLVVRTMLEFHLISHRIGDPNFRIQKGRFVQPEIPYDTLLSIAGNPSCLLGVAGASRSKSL